MRCGCAGAAHIPATRYVLRLPDFFWALLVEGMNFSEQGGSAPSRKNSVLLIEGMIFSEKGRGTPLLRKNHPWILQPQKIILGSCISIFSVLPDWQHSL
jgi:hypothetical protein